MLDFAVTRDGRRLRYDRRGQGSPVVILEAGAGGFASEWALVADPIAAVTTVVAYDRAGLGGSEPDPAPRVLSRMVDDLSDLIATVSPDGPCVIVGHSLGGPIARLLAYRHPDRVAGMVLADPTVEDFAPMFRGPAAALTSGFYRLAELLARLGLWEPMVRRRILVGELERVIQLLPPGERDAVRRVACSPATLRTSQREIGAMAASLAELAEAAAAAPPVVVPVTVLTGEMATSRAGKRLRGTVLAGHERYVGSLARGRHVRSGLAGHQIPQDDPRLVIDETLRIVGLVRESATRDTDGRDGAGQDRTGNGPLRAATD